MPGESACPNRTSRAQRSLPPHLYILRLGHTCLRSFFPGCLDLLWFGISIVVLRHACEATGLLLLPPYLLLTEETGKGCCGSLLECLIHCILRYGVCASSRLRTLLILGPLLRRSKSQCIINNGRLRYRQPLHSYLTCTSLQRLPQSSFFFLFLIHWRFGYWSQLYFLMWLDHVADCWEWVLLQQVIFVAQGLTDGPTSWRACSTLFLEQVCVLGTT